MAVVNCDLQREFAAEVALWRRDTSHLSSVRAICSHPAYLRIIAMGVRALPYLLNEFIERPDHWHLALCTITGDNPVPKEDYGDLDAMANHWLEWGRERGLD